MATRKKAKGKTARKKTPVTKAAAQKGYDGQKNEDKQEEGSEEGARPASITQES
jgi:hypothetical protein